jgi:hypothetical protein
MLNRRAASDSATTTHITIENLPFEDPALTGLCEDMSASFADSEPSPLVTEDDAAAGFVSENTILAGLEIIDGASC